jgi:hypothetical protein
VWLGLGACGIGPLGGVALASALSESRSLTALDLASSGAMSGPVRNSLGRKVRDGAPLTLPAAPTEEALHGGLSRRGKPRAAPPGAGLPRAPASSAPTRRPTTLPPRTRRRRRRAPCEAASVW